MLHPIKYNVQRILHSGIPNFCVFRMCVWHMKIKTTKFESLKILHEPHLVKIEYRQLLFCQVFEQPTQRLMISHLIKTEAKKTHKPRARSPCCAIGHV